MTENKLTIEHLAAYLPYGLKIKVIDTSFYKYDIITLSDKGDLSNIGGISYVIDEPQDFKPILRPLDHLTKKIEHNGERLIPIVELAKIAENDNWQDSEVRIKSSEKTHGMGWTKDGIRYVFAYSAEHNGFYLQSVPYKQLIIANQHKLFQMMFSWKFDVFGLLESNLALPIED